MYLLTIHTIPSVVTVEGLSLSTGTAKSSTGVGLGLTRGGLGLIVGGFGLAGGGSGWIGSCLSTVDVDGNCGLATKSDEK